MQDISASATARRGTKRIRTGLFNKRGGLCVLPCHQRHSSHYVPRLGSPTPSAAARTWAARLALLGAAQTWARGGAGEVTRFGASKLAESLPASSLPTCCALQANKSSRNPVSCHAGICGGSKPRRASHGRPFGLPMEVRGQAQAPMRGAMHRPPAAHHAAVTFLPGKSRYPWRVNPKHSSAAATLPMPRPGSCGFGLVHRPFSNVDQLSMQMQVCC